MLVKENQKSTTPKHCYFCRIKLTGGLFAIVDADDFDEIDRYYWIAVSSTRKFYAARRVITNGKSHYIYMHRQIMKTPHGQVCHHKNGNTCDNRKKNLTNMSEDEHKYIHGFR